QTAPFCAAGQTPQFQFGFAALRAAVGDPVGEPTECEHPDADGNALQKTTTGSLFWQRSTNTPVFTAGDQHWALTANGLVQWSGPSMQPPVSAAPGATGGADQQQLIAQNSARMMEEGR